MSDCIFEIRQLWQSGFSRVYSNSCYSCSFELDIIKIGQSSHKVHSNNILNFQVSTTILNACPKKYGNLLKAPRYNSFSNLLLGYNIIYRAARLGFDTKPTAWIKKSWIHVLPKSVIAIWNANSLIQNMNSGHLLHFLWWWMLHHEHLL